MPDPPAEQATRRPRRTPAYVDLERRLAVEQDRVALLARELHTAEQARGIAVNATLAAVARAERAERLLAVAVNALGQWREDDGDMAAPAADALLAIVANLAPGPDARPFRPGGAIPGHAEHPDDDEPPIEP